MKISKKILILLSLVFIASVGVAVAEEATVTPHTFTIPDDYTVAKSDDTTCAMQKDDNNAISFTTGVDEDIEASKQNFIAQGQTLIDEKTIEHNGMNIIYNHI